MENKERLTMNLSEFAVMTGTSKNLIFSLARQNKLPVAVIYLGSRRMVLSRAAVLRMLENGQDKEGVTYDHNH